MINVSVLQQITSQGRKYDIQHSEDYHPEADASCPGCDVIVFSKYDINTPEIVCCSKCGEVRSYD